jgi:hypothetical protein
MPPTELQLTSALSSGRTSPRPCASPPRNRLCQIELLTPTGSERPLDCRGESLPHLDAPAAACIGTCGSPPPEGMQPVRRAREQQILSPMA